MVSSDEEQAAGQVPSSTTCEYQFDRNDGEEAHTCELMTSCNIFCLWWHYRIEDQPKSPKK